jgi:hypothetical protein
MNTHPLTSALARLTLLLLLAATVAVTVAVTAATPEEEARFVDAARKAFAEKKPGDLSKLTCWDGVLEPDQKKQEETFKLLMEEKDVTFSLKLVDAEEKAVAEKERKAEGAPTRPNLKIVKQLDVTLIDPRDPKRILGIIGFAVGEKDGKLLLVREAPAK